MPRASAATLLTAATLLSSPFMFGTAYAQHGDLLQMQSNPANVVMPTITYDNQR